MSALPDLNYVADCKVISLPRIQDARGNLTFLEGGSHVPFSIRRAYWIYDVPGGAVRGGHAYAELEEVMIALSGSFDVVVEDGQSKRTMTLNRSYYGFYVPRLLWRQIDNFSTNAVCLIVASAEYDENDYIREYREFLRIRKVMHVGA